MKFVINTIVRQRRKTLDSWREQILALASLNPGDQFHLFVVENCSFDGSKEFLAQADFSTLTSYTYALEDLGTPHYGSVKDKHRVEILATQRNKCLNIARQGHLDDADKVVFIEPDISYDPVALSPLLRSDADVISPVSIQGNCPFYDTWSVRRTSLDTDWIGERPTVEIPVYATWCQFCVCKARPIVEHDIRFSGFNDRFNTWDNDVSSFIEGFHKAGYHDVRLDGRVTVEHIPSH